MLSNCDSADVVKMLLLAVCKQHKTNRVYFVRKCNMHACSSAASAASHTCSQICK